MAAPHFHRRRTPPGPAQALVSRKEIEVWKGSARCSATSTLGREERRRPGKHRRQGGGSGGRWWWEGVQPAVYGGQIMRHLPQDTGVQACIDVCGAVSSQSRNTIFFRRHLCAEGTTAISVCDRGRWRAAKLNNGSGNGGGYELPKKSTMPRASSSALALCLDGWEFLFLLNNQTGLVTSHCQVANHPFNSSCKLFPKDAIFSA
jgi:hypothetical protein